jgi:hypothetical protein
VLHCLFRHPDAQKGCVLPCADEFLTIARAPRGTGHVAIGDAIGNAIDGIVDAAGSDA